MRSALFVLLSCAAAVCQIANSGGVPVLGSTGGGGISCGAAFTCGTATGYACGFSLTIAQQASLSGNLTNIDMPFLGDQGAVTIFKSVANGGAISSSPKEVVFCTKNDGTGSIVPSETVTSAWSATSGAGEWWVQDPSVSTSGTTKVYGLVGKSGAVDYSNPATITGAVSSGVCTLGETMTQGTTGITGIFNLASPFTIADLSGPGADASHLWTGGSSGCQFTPTSAPASILWSGAQFVQHWGSASLLVTTDSTYQLSYTNNGATATAGPISGGAAFLASSSQYMQSSQSFSCCASFTFEEAIANANAGNAVQAVGNNANNAGGTGEVNYVLASGTASCTFTACVGLGYFSATSTFYYKLTNASIGTSSATHWLAGSHTTGTANMTIYLDGATSNGAVNSGGSPVDPAIAATPWYWGRNGNFTSLNYFTGSLFETRLWNSVLSADQIKFHYLSQSSPATTYTLSTP